MDDHVPGRAVPAQLKRHIPLVALLAAVAALGIGLVVQSAGLMLLAVALVVAASVGRSQQAAPARAAVALICVGLALAEWLTPVFFSPPAEPSTVEYAEGYKGERTDIGSQPNPGRHASSRRTSTGDVVYDVTYTIGPDRLRVTPDNPVGPYRVNFLGCSYTFGEGLQDNETLPYAFAALARDVHVVNYGFHGYGAHQALAILESDRDTSGEINFFLTAPFHAERSACKPVWTEGSPRYVLNADGSLSRNGRCGDASDPLPYLRSHIATYSNIVAVIDRAMRLHLTDADMALYVALVKRMAELSHQRGQRFIVGFLGNSKGTLYGTSYTSAMLIKTFASSADDVGLLDLTKSWPEQREKYQISEMDSHPNARANRERAVILAEGLRRYLK